MGPSSDFRALMVIRGPLGIGRHALTQIESWREPTLLSGTANVGARTTVGVRWELQPIGRRSTHVVLRATVRSSSAFDRFLLRVGGAAWIRRLFTNTLDLLATHAGTAAAPDRASQLA